MGVPSSRRSSALVASGILLSRLAGLARERVLAHYLGVSVAADAFRAALRIPNLMQNLLGEGVLSASFVPAYSRLLDEDEEQARRVAGSILALLSAAVATITLAGVLLARPIVVLLTPGFSGARLELTVTLTKVLFLGGGFLVISAWCIGVLNSHRRFFLSYVAPVLWNMAMIAAVVTVALRGAGSRDVAAAVAWGAVAGAALQAGVQLPSALRVSRGAWPVIAIGIPEVRTILRRLGPAIAGRGSVQLGAYIDILLASLLAVGAVTALAFAQVLYTLPISLFGMSVAAAELPELARADSSDMWRQRLDDGLRRIAFAVVPCTVAYLVTGDVLVGALLQTGRFGTADTRLVWLVLAGYAIGLFASTSSRLLQSALYASGDTRTPAVASIVRFSAAAAAGFALMIPFDDLTISPGGLHLGAVGLAIASGTAAWVELALLRRRVAQIIGRVPLGGAEFSRVVAASLVAGAIALALRFAVPPWHPVLRLLVVGTPAALGYLVAARMLAVRELEPLLAFARMPRRGD